MRASDFSQSLEPIAELPAIPEHARQVKWALPHRSFHWRRDASVAVQIAVPFAMFRVGEMAETPVVEEPVPVRVALLAGQRPGKPGGDDRFAVRPPEFHV